MRGVKTFAYDLDVSVGGVSSRVALLLRSTEPKPICPCFEKNLPMNRTAFSGLSKGDFVSSMFLGCNYIDPSTRSANQLHLPS
jgi:hypothetical protein